jgi:hypothetical protein
MPDPDCPDTIPAVTVTGLAARMLDSDSDPASQPIPYILTALAEAALDEPGWP